MTKKDYELIADSINAVVFRYGRMVRELEAITEVAKELAYNLHTQNPNFDYDKFYKAVGIAV